MRIFSGRTLDRGTVAYTSSTIAQHASLRLPNAADPGGDGGGATSPVIGRVTCGPVTSNVFVLAQQQHQQQRNAHPVGDSPRILFHPTWNPQESAILYANAAPIQGLQASTILVRKPLPMNPRPLFGQMQSCVSTMGQPGTPPDKGNYVSLGRRQNYAELAFSPKPIQQLQQQTAALRYIPGSADSTLAHIPPPMATLSLTKLKSVLSSCPPQHQEKDGESGGLETPTGPLLSPSRKGENSDNSTINRLYDMDISCSSVGYESLAELRTTTNTGSSDPSSTSKNDRKVYEDAEALYRHLKVADEMLPIPNHSPPEPPNSLSSSTHPEGT